MSRSPESFFTWKQKVDHAQSLIKDEESNKAVKRGWQCEWFIGKGQRCEERGHLEAEHLLSVKDGGATEDENLTLSCIVHHFISHFLKGDTNVAKSIKARMTESEKERLKRLGY